MTGRTELIEEIGQYYLEKKGTNIKEKEISEILTKYKKAIDVMEKNDFEEISIAEVILDAYM